MAAHFQLSAIIKSIQNAIVFELIFNICQRLQKICLLFDYQQKKRTENEMKIMNFQIGLFIWRTSVHICCYIRTHTHTLGILWYSIDRSSTRNILIEISASLSHQLHRHKAFSVFSGQQKISRIFISLRTVWKSTRN